MSFGPNPWQQQSWDARAAGNFIGGGAGTGLIVFAAFAGASHWVMLVGAALVACGLASVALEIGRPLRALNVVRHPGRSWMTREALVAPLLFAAVAAVWLLGAPGWLAALPALAFVYCQSRMLQAAKGIPAWREPLLSPLIVATALAEGGGLLLLLGATVAPAAPAAPTLWIGLAAALLARLLLWNAWRARIRTAPRALAAIDRAGLLFKATTLLALAVAVVALMTPMAPLAGAGAGWLQGAAGLLAVAGGVWFKYTLITRGGFNQGFALARLPVRGARRA